MSDPEFAWIHSCFENYDGHARTQCVRELLTKDRESVMAISNGGATPLQAAVWQKDVVTAALLLRFGADPNYYKSGCETILGDAANIDPEGRAIEFCLLLIASGANFLLGGLSGTPLHVAAAKGYVNLCEILLALGADINSRAEPDRETPLWMAVTHEKIDVVKLLVNRGADCNLLTGFLGQGIEDTLRLVKSESSRLRIREILISPKHG